MSEKERLILIDLAKSTKTLAVKNQNYECAALTRDLEKYLERGDTKTDLAEEFYDKIFEKFSQTLNWKQDNDFKLLEDKFKISKKLIFRQILRQKLLDELFKD